MVSDQPVSLSSRKRRSAFAAAAVVLLVLLIGFWPGFDEPGVPMDEGMLLVYPEQVAHGQIPYRDFETFYGPANPYLLAGAFSVFGTNIFTERGVGLLYRLVAVLAIFGIARRWGTLLASGCMFIAGALLICPHFIASAWIAAMACALAAVWVVSSNLASARRYFFAGLLAGLAVLFRPDVAPVVILSSLPFLWGVNWRTRGQYAAGLGLALLPLAIISLLAGVTNVWNNLFFYPVIASNPGRRLPLLSAAPYVLNLLVLHLIGSLGILAIAVAKLRKERASNKGLVLLSMGAMALVLTPQVTQRLDLGHLLFAGLVSLPFLAIAIASLSERMPMPGKTSAMVGILAAMAFIEIAAPELTVLIRNALGSGLGANEVSALFVHQEGRSFPFRSQDVALSCVRLFEKLETLSKPGERLFVGPGDLRRTNYSDTFIYHLFPKLRPATYFLEMNPFSANRPGSRLATDVASADWLVLNRAWDNWQEANRSVENGEDTANNVVRTQFTPVGEYGTYLLFQRKLASKGQP
jgi:hypothetical protein